MFKKTWWHAKQHLFILERIFIPHFYLQFHDIGYKKFFICSEALHLKLEFKP